MIGRRAVLASLVWASLFTRSFPSFAQQPASVARIGFLGSGRPLALWHALETALRERGYVEYRNIAIERQWIGGDHRRLPALGAELVRSKAAVIVASGTPATLAAKRATGTIPIVMVNAGDAVASGLVASLARPGGNVTGTTILSGELMAKRLELLKEAVPHIRQVAVLINPANPVYPVSWEAAQGSAEALKLEVQRFDAQEPREIAGAFAKMAAHRVDAVSIAQETLFVANAKAIAELAVQHRLASIGFGEFAEAGGLIGYGVDFSEVYRRSAYFVERILKGATPGELPVERPTSLKLAVNLRTAKALGQEIAPTILLRANRAIE